jgi:2-oxoglutarate ferredoxin oxidoreductase subunit alpha
VSEAAFAKICLRHGLHVFSYGEYPSLIRGGHTSGQVHAGSEPVSCQKRMLDIMVALNEESVTQHTEEFTSETILIVDKTTVKLDWEKYAAVCKVFDLPMHAISLEATGASLADNMVALGASCYLLGLQLDIASQLITESFQRKGDEVVAKNIAALTKGYEYFRTQKIASRPKIPVKRSQEIFLSGNEAIGLGALAAGLQFYAGYPMTPTSSLLTFFAKHQEDYPILVKHAEDEISAINQAIGVAFAGARAMVGTSGGGFALMVEATSLAAIAETPLVVVEGQRPGPATGLPTWTCQADLQFVMHAGHGEFPKVVLTPGDMNECFQMTRLALMLAEKYHTQVYIMGDKFLLESSQSTPRFPDSYTNQRFSMISEELPVDNSYKRFVVNEDGYSPRSIPGQPHGLQLTNSYEHDEHGYATEDAKMTAAMVEKRLRKLPALSVSTPKPAMLGPADADITFVSWGSTKLVIEEVLRQLNAIKQNTANAIQLSTVMPFHSDEFMTLAKRAKRLVMVEGNAMHQCELLIREQTSLTFKERINRYDGRPFYAEDIVEWFQSGSTKATSKGLR